MKLSIQWQAPDQIDHGVPKLSTLNHEFKSRDLCSADPKRSSHTLKSKTNFRTSGTGCIGRCWLNRCLRHHSSKDGATGRQVTRARHTPGIAGAQGCLVCSGGNRGCEVQGAVGSHTVRRSLAGNCGDSIDALAWSAALISSGSSPSCSCSDRAQLDKAQTSEIEKGPLRALAHNHQEGRPAQKRTRQGWTKTFRTDSRLKGASLNPEKPLNAPAQACCRPSVLQRLGDAGLRRVYRLFSAQSVGWRLGLWFRRFRVASRLV